MNLEEFEELCRVLLVPRVLTNQSDKQKTKVG